MMLQSSSSSHRTAPTTGASEQPVVVGYFSAKRAGGRLERRTRVVARLVGRGDALRELLQLDLEAPRRAGVIQAQLRRLGSGWSTRENGATLIVDAVCRPLEQRTASVSGRFGRTPRSPSSAARGF